MRGWPVLRLIENFRFTNAPTAATGFDMLGVWSGLLTGKVMATVELGKEGKKDVFEEKAKRNNGDSE